MCQIRDYYNGIEADDNWAISYRQHVNNDRLVARYLTHYGFRYKNETQHLSNEMIVYGTGIFGHAFCPDPSYTVSYHHNAASWLPIKSRRKRLLHLLDQLGLHPRRLRKKRFCK